jgi:hypothetical protein
MAKPSLEKPLWTQIAVDSEFEDIRLVDMEVAKTTWSRVHETMRVVYFKLSAQPPDLMWHKYFVEERESRIGLRRRGLWIEQGYLSFDCLLDEIEHYHLPDVQRSLDYANRKYREYLTARRKERAEAHSAERDEIVELEKLRQRLHLG